MLKALSFLILGACISTAAFAKSYARPLSKEAGWEFTLSLNVGYSNGESQFSTDDDNAITEDLNNGGQSRTSGMVFPLGRVQYTLDSLKTQFYLGNSFEQVTTAQFQYELGVVHQFSDNSKLTFAVFPKLSLLNDTWADPFLTGSERQVTEENTGGARLAIEQIFGSPLTLKYAIASSSIDDELSGQNELDLSVEEIASLERDSLYQRVEVETMFPVAKGIFLKPTFQYTNRNADGDANSFNQYTGQLGVLIFKGKHFLVATLNAGVKRYQQVNPIFGMKQDSTHAGLFSIYTYKKPFNWERWSLTAIAGYNKEKSDIAFYSSNGLIISAGIAFKY